MGILKWTSLKFQKVRAFLGFQSRPTMGKEGRKFMMDEFRSTRGRGGGPGMGGPRL